MRRLLIFTLFLLCFENMFSKISIIPQPVTMVEKNGAFVFDSQTKVYFQTEDQREAASFFISRLELVRGEKLKEVNKRPKKNALIFVYSDSLPNEGYKLTVMPEFIQVESSSKAGFYYATQSLLQLLPVEVFRSTTFSDLEWKVPAVFIQDSPSYPYRGFMLDVARYFLPKDEVLKLIDNLALHKLNKFHWHLVDDNGWRIEIKKYPLLGAVGGYRVKRESLFPSRKNPMPGEPTPEGGFYTQEEIKEIVKYAQDRCVEVIPEIEMPAHTNSSLAAYPHLACPVVKDF
ncbi:MAG: family 20 glycosylhydrolase, partial [Bacteroidales bacterium]